MESNVCLFWLIPMFVCSERKLLQVVPPSQVVADVLTHIRGEEAKPYFSLWTWWGWWGWWGIRWWRWWGWREWLWCLVVTHILQEDEFYSRSFGEATVGIRTSLQRNYLAVKYFCSLVECYITKLKNHFYQEKIPW